MRKLETLVKDLKSLGDKWYETEQWKSLSNGKKELVRKYNRIQCEKEREFSIYEIITEKLFIEDITWENEYEDLYEAMKELEINEFIFADCSTACLRTLNFFINKGCKIKGNEIYKTEELFGQSERIDHQGIVIEL